MIDPAAHAVFEHPALLLLAAGAGSVIALAYLAADYLIIPAWRLYATRRRGPFAVRALLERERRRLHQLRNTAAVYEEHGDPDAAALREEAELRALIAALLLGRT